MNVLVGNGLSPGITFSGGLSTSFEAASELAVPGQIIDLIHPVLANGIGVVGTK